MINGTAEGSTKKNSGQDEKEFLKGTFFKLNLK